MTEELRDIYRDLESRYVHEGRTIDHLLHRDHSDDSCLSLQHRHCIYSDAWGLDELEKTLEQIPPYRLRLPAIDDIRNLIHRRTTHEKIDKEGKTIHKLPNQIETNELFDHLRTCELEMYSLEIDKKTKSNRKISSLKAKQPKKPPPKRTRNVGKSKRVELTTSSSNESPPSDNGDLPSTKISPRSYSRALPPNPNMSKEQKKTRGMFKKLGRVLYEFAKMLKKDAVEGSFVNDACNAICFGFATKRSSGDFCKEHAIHESTIWWILRCSVPTGRVVVPAGRYVVPAGKVIIIVIPVAKSSSDWSKYIVPLESKARTTLLQSIPDDHVANFHYMDDARDIWNAVALTLKTKGGLELLSFDDLYYKLKTLEVDIKGYSTFSSSQSAGLSHSAFVSTTSASKKMSYADSLSYSSSTYTAPTNSKTGHTNR
ncbi:hypothetical protein Tco_0833961 [Tanacetum coccineum]